MAKHEHQDKWNTMLLEAWKANVPVWSLTKQFLLMIEEEDYGILLDIRRTPRAWEQRIPVRAFVAKHGCEALNAKLWKGFEVADLAPIFLEYKWYNNIKKDLKGRGGPRKTGRRVVKARDLNTSTGWNVVS